MAGWCCEDLRRAPVSFARPFLDAIAGGLRWGLLLKSNSGEIRLSFCFQDIKGPIIRDDVTG